MTLVHSSTTTRTLNIIRKVRDARILINIHRRCCNVAFLEGLGFRVKGLGFSSNDFSSCWGNLLLGIQETTIKLNKQELHGWVRLAG